MSKIRLEYQTLRNQRLTAFNQLFSWTSDGLSKCLINNMIGSQDHLGVSAASRVQHDIIQRLLETNPFQINQLPNQP